LLVYEYRYPDDPFDNYWFPIMPNSSYVQSSAQVETLNATGLRMYQMFPPPAVMNTALTTNGNMTITIQFTRSYIWFMTLFLAELNSSSTINREFYMEVPGYSPTLELVDLETYANPSEVVELEYYGTVPDSVSLFTDQTSATLWGPLVNAMEIFEVSESQMAILTNQQDSKSSTKSQNANFTLNPDNYSN
jgi:hypothetical protein